MWFSGSPAKQLVATMHLQLKASDFPSWALWPFLQNIKEVTLVGAVIFGSNLCQRRRELSELDNLLPLIFKCLLPSLRGFLLTRRFSLTRILVAVMRAAIFCSCSFPNFDCPDSWQVYDLPNSFLISLFFYFNQPESGYTLCNWELWWIRSFTVLLHCLASSNLSSGPFFFYKLYIFKVYPILSNLCSTIISTRLHLTISWMSKDS